MRRLSKIHAYDLNKKLTTRSLSSVGIVPVQQADGDEVSSVLQDSTSTPNGNQTNTNVRDLR